MRSALLIALWICFAVLTPQLLSAQSCDKLTGKSNEVLLSYLENYPKNDLGQECVPFAIKTLANDRHDERAARVLARYLDYYWKEPGCEMISGGRCSRGPYPATDSLMEIGDVSRPYVLEALESDSQRSRENAIDVYYFFIREDTTQGVAALRWEADRAGNSTTKERLMWAASALAKKWCFPFEKRLHNCDAALAGTLPFDVAEDTQVVYGTVLPKESSPWPFREYAIAKRTDARDWCSSEKVIRGCINHSSKEESEYDSAISDFIVRNRSQELLGRVMRAVDKPYVVLDDKQVTAYRNKLKNSTKTIPDDQAPDYQFGISGPLLSVSRVGFSHGGAIAIVYVRHDCPSGCSGGALHVLRRRANFWMEETKQEFQP